MWAAPWLGWLPGYGQPVALTGQQTEVQTLTAVLTTGRILAAVSLVETETVTVALTVERPLAGAALGENETVSAPFDVRRSLAANLGETETVSPTLTRYLNFTGAVQETETVQAALRRAMALSVSLLEIEAQAGTLAVSRLFTAAAGPQQEQESLTAAALAIRRLLAGVDLEVEALYAHLTIGVPPVELTGTLDQIMALSGALTVGRELAGAVIQPGTVSADGLLISRYLSAAQVLNEVIRGVLTGAPPVAGQGSGYTPFTVFQVSLAVINGDPVIAVRGNLAAVLAQDTSRAGEVATSANAAQVTGGIKAVLAGSGGTSVKVG